MEHLLAGLMNPHLKEIDLSLERMERLLEALGHPQKRLPPVIHVAGTNGKGSLIAYLRAIFEAQGKRVHAYTSPHLVRFHERIVLAGSEVEDAPLYEALQKVAGLQDEFPATFFEATTAAAFLLFSQTPADVLLLEVGLGGRLDATNVLDAQDTALMAIAPVSLDHTEYLGGTLAEIAGEKAGILKAGVPCVVGPQELEAMEVIERKAENCGSPLFRFGREWRLNEEGGRLVYQGAKKRLVLPAPALEGRHQLVNAATAVACAEFLGGQLGDITDAALVEGVQKAYWPGRLQPFHAPWLLKHLPTGSRIWLDGGHNPAAGRVLAEWTHSLDAKPYLICGMRSAKDARGFLQELHGAVQGMVAMSIPDEQQSMAASDLAGIAHECGLQSEVASNPVEAVRKIIQFEDGNRPVNVVISGSLYLVGCFLKQGLHF